MLGASVDRWRPRCIVFPPAGLTMTIKNIIGREMYQWHTFCRSPASDNAWSHGVDHPCELLFGFCPIDCSVGCGIDYDCRIKLFENSGDIVWLSEINERAICRN